MISMRSAAWTVTIMELVLSCVAIISSLAIVSAEFNSISLNGTPFKPSLTAISTCLMSFALLLSAIVAMFGLSGRKASMLLPHITVSCIVLLLHAVMSVLWLHGWRTSERVVDGDWLISLVLSTLFQCALFVAICVELCCYRRMTY